MENKPVTPQTITQKYLAVVYAKQVAENTYLRGELD